MIVPKFFHPRSRRGVRGSSLLLVLWAIMLMSFAIMGLVTHLSHGLDESIEAEKQFRARLLLQSARTLASHPDIEWGDPLLRQRVSSTTSYEIKLGTEGMRLAVNQIAANPAQQKFARRLFEKWGMEPADAETLVESIADWVDADTRPRPHGAEAEYYLPRGNPDQPYNRAFDNLDDLLLVRGGENLDLVKPDWRDALTLFGDGTIDLHRAPTEILEALFDVTPAEIKRLETARLGPDGLPDTDDDRRFATLAEARRVLDVPPPNYAAVASLLTLEHPILRAECLAVAGNVERRLTIIRGPGLFLIRER